MMEQFNAQVSHVDGARVYVMLHATRADAAGFPTSNTFAAELMNASLQAADLTDGARTVSVVGVDGLATISDDPIQKNAIVATLKMGGELRLNTQTSEGALAIDANTDRETFLSNLTRAIRAPYVSARRVARH